jgi:hypothetical protein
MIAKSLGERPSTILNCHDLCCASRLWDGSRVAAPASTILALAHYQGQVSTTATSSAAADAALPIHPAYSGWRVGYRGRREVTWMLQCGGLVRSAKGQQHVLATPGLARPSGFLVADYGAR